MPTLTVKSGPAAGRSLPIEGDVVIGREAADLTIEDQELSRRHVVIRPAGNGVEIEDLGSTNGTMVNGRRIEAPVTITAGAIVEVGTSRIAIELAQPDATRMRPQPIADVDQPTRARAVQPPPASEPAPPAAPATEAEPAPAAAAPAPPAAPKEAAPPDQPPAAPGQADAGGKGPKGRLLVVGGVLAILALLAVAGVLLLGGDSDEAEARTLDGTVTTLPLADAASFQVSGVMNGEPVDDSAVVIQRRFATPPTRGGKAVPVRGFLLFTPPGGTFSLNFAGTLRLTRSGGEQLRASGTAGNGVRDFEGMKGSFRMSGGRSSTRSGTARFTLTGKLEY